MSKELENLFLIKLKIILRSNFFYCLFIGLALFYTFFTLYFYTPRSKYSLKENTLEGTILSLKNKEQIVTLVVQGKEKVLVKVYLKTKQEENIWKQYQIGDKLSLKGTFSVPSKNSNFYLFNYRNYLYSQKIYRLFTVSSSNKIKGNHGLYRLKNKLIKRLSAYQSSSYMKAFLLGDTSQIEDTVRESFQKNGISHLLSISGMHIVFFTFYVLKIGRRLFQNEKASYICCFIVLFFYLFVAGFPTSMVRASIFFILQAFHKLFYLGLSKMKIWLVTFGIFLYDNPFLVYQIGFLFTFTISFFLLLASQRIHEKKNYGQKTFYTAYIAFLASLPIVINTSFEISPLTPLWNLVFVPFVSFLLFPFSFLCLFFPVFDSLFLGMAQIFENASLLVSNVPCVLSIPYMSFYSVILYYFFLFLTIRKRKIRYQCLPSLFICFFLMSHLYRSHSIITMIDVGQGDSILIEQKDGKNILMDTGGKPMYNQVKQQKEKRTSLTETVLLPYLKARGIYKLDVLILTHGDLDHIGESLSLLKKMPIQYLILNSGKDTEREKEIMREALRKKIKYKKISQGKIKIGSNTWYFLNPKNEQTENKDSLIAYTHLASYNILFMGDAEKENEKEVQNVYNLPKMDILKVGHHGSKTSTASSFIQKIKPAYALISVGEKNQYGHPHPAVVQTLQKEHAKIYMTSQHGMVRLHLEQKIRVEICGR